MVNINFKCCKVNASSTFKIGLTAELHYSTINWTDTGVAQHRALALDYLEDFCVKMNDTFEPNFVFVFGDLIHEDGTKADQQARLVEIQDMLDTLTMSDRLTCGNHDLVDMTKAEVLTSVSETSLNYTAEISDYLIVSLDAMYENDGTSFGGTGQLGAGSGYIPKEELDWLENVLELTNRKVIIFLSAVIDEISLEGSYWGEYPASFVSNRAEVRKVLEDSEKVVAVFQANFHWSNSMKINGIPYFHIRCLVGDENKEGANGFINWQEVTIDDLTETVTVECYENLVKEKTMTETYTVTVGADIGAILSDIMPIIITLAVMTMMLSMLDKMGERL